eukprot:scaffold650_cov249-Pinguiococcus_pyrenoidosus.AAC.15
MAENGKLRRRLPILPWPSQPWLAHEPPKRRSLACQTFVALVILSRRRRPPSTLRWALWTASDGPFPHGKRLGGAPRRPPRWQMSRARAQAHLPSFRRPRLSQLLERLGAWLPHPRLCARPCMPDLLARQSRSACAFGWASRAPSPSSSPLGTRCEDRERGAPDSESSTATSRRPLQILLRPPENPRCTLHSACARARGPHDYAACTGRPGEAPLPPPPPRPLPKAPPESCEPRSLPLASGPDARCTPPCAPLPQARACAARKQRFCTAVARERRADPATPTASPSWRRGAPHLWRRRLGFRALAARPGAPESLERCHRRGRGAARRADACEATHSSETARRWIQTFWRARLRRSRIRY